MVWVKGEKNNCPLRIGLAGLGQAGSGMIPVLLKNPNIKITAAADINRSQLEAFRMDFQAETYESVEDLCRSNQVDAVYISTPTPLHVEHVMIAATYGKHILVEKPMAIRLEDADAMISAAERNGVKLVVVHKRCYDPPIHKIREIVSSGMLGRLRMVHNWHFNDWLYRPRLPAELDTQQGGGVIFRQACHQVDMIRYIGGGLLRSVRAMTGSWDEKRPTEGNYTAYLEFEDGTSATSIYSGYDRFQSSELSYGIDMEGRLVDPVQYGEARKNIARMKDEADERKLKSLGGYRKPKAKKAVHQPFFGLTIVSCEEGDIRQSPNGLIIYGNERKHEIILPADDTGRDAVVRDFFHAVAYDKPSTLDGRWGKANLEVCIGILDSSRKRKEVYLKYQTAVNN